MEVERIFGSGKFQSSLYTTVCPHTPILLKSTQGDNKKLQWDEPSSQAFQDIKQVMAEVSLLTHAHHDALTSIMTDASDTAVGAVLQQEID